MLQAAPRGLMKDRLVIFSASDHVLQPLGNRMPDGVIVGARGSNGQFAEKSPINDWYVAALAKAHPGSIRCSRTIARAQGVLAAEDRGRKGDGGERRQEADHRGNGGSHGRHEWDAPSGHIKLALGDGHQAIQSNAAGRIKWDADAKMVRAGRHRALCRRVRESAARHQVRRTGSRKASPAPSATERQIFSRWPERDAWLASAAFLP